jgi:hypothetical protein
MRKDVEIELHRQPAPFFSVPTTPSAQGAIMKSFKSTIFPLALLALGAQSAMAESPVYEYPQPIVSATSRADVKAQTAAARAAGLIASGEASYELPVAVASSGLTRVQVRAEAIEARRLGLIPHGEMGSRDATPAELESIRQAGLKALQLHLAARQ